MLVTCGGINRATTPVTTNRIMSLFIGLIRDKLFDVLSSVTLHRYVISPLVLRGIMSEVSEMNRASY